MACFLVFVSLVIFFKLAKTLADYICPKSIEDLGFRTPSDFTENELALDDLRAIHEQYEEIKNITDSDIKYYLDHEVLIDHKYD